MYNETTCANYTGDDLRMEFYLHMLITLTHKGDTIFNMLGGGKPMYIGLVSLLDCLCNFGQSQKKIHNVCLHDIVLF